MRWTGPVVQKQHPLHECGKYQIDCCGLKGTTLSELYKVPGGAHLRGPLPVQQHYITGEEDSNSPLLHLQIKESMSLDTPMSIYYICCSLAPALCYIICHTCCCQSSDCHICCWSFALLSMHISQAALFWTSSLSITIIVFALLSFCTVDWYLFFMPLLTFLQSFFITKVREKQHFDPPVCPVHVMNWQ